MHEAGIAASIIEISEAEARKYGSAPIERIRLRLGDFAGIVPEALEFAFEALKPGTLAAGALLDIERIPLTAACPSCQWVGEPPRELCLFCPRCQDPLEILTGRELDVQYIDLQEKDPLPCNASP